jgi:hypothetical protein
MGKNGLSPLQIDIMAVLDEFPALEEVPRGNLSSWAFPKDILTACGGRASNRAAISKALHRLYGRGLVARASGEAASVGKSFRYVRITNPANATGSSGPGMILNKAKPKMRTVG